MRDSLKEPHFLRLSRTMEEITGIQLPASKRIMIEGRLRRRVRQLGMEHLEDYGIYLFDQDGFTAERSFLIDCVTTNKTDFFREPEHFKLLRDLIVPALLRRQDRSGPYLKIWSAAASTGAEAYTLAMVLDDMHQSGVSMRFSILGTDICGDVLEQARRAVYPSVMMDPVPANMRKRYVMEATNSQRAEVRIVPLLRRLVQFEALNLMDASYPFDRDVDVIFCRNVLIYFSRVDQQAVLRRLSSHLRPGGYLVLGHSESFAMEDKSGMVQVSQTVFERTSSGLIERAA